MSRSATSLSDKLAARLRTFEKSRKKIERLLRSGHVTRHDVNLFYEGIFLKTITSFESFLEELFIGLLTGGIEPGRNVRLRAQFKSSVIARDITFGGRAYVDWLPYDHTEKRANAFFRRGQPFSRLDRCDKRELDRMLTIRNSIAHQSRAARTKFNDNVLASIPLLPSERTPAGFLRSVLSLEPIQTQYQNIAGECSLLAHKLCQ